MRRALLATVFASLVSVGTASAGGWATAGLGPPPDGTSAGDTWNAQVTILQHGQTPLVGAKPTVTIRNTKTGKAATFPARPTGEPGVYLAKVKIPSAGTWKYEVYDGFTQYGGAKTHTFATFKVGAAGDSGSFPVLPSLAGGALVLLLGAAGLLLLIRRQRRTAPVPA